MRIWDYFKDRIVFLVANLLVITLLCSVLLFFPIGKALIIPTVALWFGPLLIYMILELIKEKRYYDEVMDALESLDRKYLLPEVVKEPSFVEGKLLHRLLKETSKDMHEQVNFYRNLQREYREYIEIWVHEAKTPIASAKLIIDNNEGPATKAIDYELKKMDDYVEQVLYYSRSQNVSNDFIVRRVSLEQIVASAIRRNARDFIYKRIAIDIDSVHGTVFSDAKWLEFILNQIIGNAIKYCKKGEGNVTVRTDKTRDHIHLTIEDNGIGIVERDVGRVWEKGFTGENGRLFGKSTGIGLYLCKSLCNKLGLEISLTSQVGEGTKVSLLFPKQSEA
ncbi:HAMP domain-containing sensor histidine kinase [Paenibacillus sp. CF384]|uniref:sensor histidine kinase n=1 Tax=Paenibacillus sp. CF384 TaxID=1884382 RepID=UPI00089A3C8D|nr:sensor histidine kinase [Paenibacillus sp. CF384]SDW23124.1 Signal transduction histidine kinase [Paenibacillus sp. CF384]